MCFLLMKVPSINEELVNEWRLEVKRATEPDVVSMEPSAESLIEFGEAEQIEETKAKLESKLKNNSLRIEKRIDEIKLRLLQLEKEQFKDPFAKQGDLDSFQIKVYKNMEKMGGDLSPDQKKDLDALERKQRKKQEDLKASAEQKTIENTREKLDKLGLAIWKSQDANKDRHLNYERLMGGDREEIPDTLTRFLDEPEFKKIICDDDVKECIKAIRDKKEGGSVGGSGLQSDERDDDVLAMLELSEHMSANSHPPLAHMHKVYSILKKRIEEKMSGSSSEDDGSEGDEKPNIDEHLDVDQHKQLLQKYCGKIDGWLKLLKVQILERKQDKGGATEEELVELAT